MVDTVQVVLLFVIVLLTVLLLILGVQVFFILKELRSTLSHANKVLENAETISENVSEPISFISGLFSSSHSVSAIAKFIKSLRKSPKEEEDE